MEEGSIFFVAATVFLCITLLKKDQTKPGCRQAGN